MKTPTKPHQAGFTLTELAVVLILVLILGTVVLPMLARGRRRGPHPALCVNNLKEVGLAFRLWAGDHGDRFPMQVSTNEGGALEWALQGEVFRVFQVMWNELSTPRTVVCPQDRRAMAYSFGSTVPPGVQASPFTGNSNVSYFVGLGATQEQAESWLTGDANLMVGGKALPPGQCVMTNGQLAGWTTNRHGNLGYLCLGDGTVQQYRLPPWLPNSPASVRLVIP